MFHNCGNADLEARYYDPTRPSDFEALTGISPVSTPTPTIIRPVFANNAKN